MGPSYSLEYRNGKWFYETEDDFTPIDILIDGPVTMDEHNNNEIITRINSEPGELFPSENRISRLHFYLKRYCSNWQKEFGWMQYKDGTFWECDIQGNGLNLKSRGQVETPGNFETFLNKLTKFTEGKYFGPGIM